MMPENLITIILFAGFNEVALPKDALLVDVQVDGYQLSLVFKTKAASPSGYRQFYVAFNSGPIDYSQGILQLLKKIEFPDGTSIAMIYEVFPYKERG